MLCNAAITENYKCNPKSPNKFQKFSEQLTGNTIPPTLEVALTKKKTSAELRWQYLMDMDMITVITFIRNCESHLFSRCIMTIYQSSTESKVGL